MESKKNWLCLLLLLVSVFLVLSDGDGNAGDAAPEILILHTPLAQSNSSADVFGHFGYTPMSPSKRYNASADSIRMVDEKIQELKAAGRKYPRRASYVNNVKFSNPFDNSFGSVSSIAIFDNGAGFNVLPPSIARYLNLPVGSPCTITGIGNFVSRGSQAVATVEIFDKPFDIAFCLVDDPPATEILLNCEICELWAVCFCPAQGPARDFYFSKNANDCANVGASP